MTLGVAKARIRLRLAVRKGLAFIRRVVRYFTTGSDDRLLDPTFVDHAGNNKLVLIAANKRKINVKKLPSEVLMFEHNGQRAFSQGAGFQFESMVTHLICADKELASMVLEMSGLPVPKHGVFNLSTYADAVAFVRDLPGSAVVKPCRGTWGGVGVTVGVDTDKEVEAAFLAALMHCPDVMIEEFIAGTCYRFTVLDDKVITVNKMVAASITGDGKTSVSELVRLQNTNLVDEFAQEGQNKKIEIDDEVARMLQRQSLSLDHIPKEGERVQLKGTANSSVGGYSCVVTDNIHPEVMKLAIDATAAVKARLCGVDIIAKDVSVPVAEADIFLNEVNTTPGLYGIDVSVCDKILDLLLAPEDGKKPSVRKSRAKAK